MLKCLLVVLISSMAMAQTSWERSVAPGEPIQPAIDALRERGERPAKIILKAGRHRLTEPLVLTPADSHLSIIGEPGAVLDGSQVLPDWQAGEVNGRRALVRAYDGPQVRALYVNGETRHRPRFPKSGFLRIESVPGLEAGAPLSTPADRFVLKEGDFIAKASPEDVELITLQLWIAARFPYKGYDPATRLFTSTHTTPFKLHEGWGEEAKPSRYYIENAREALTEPGEFYHDRSEGKLYYLPKDGETAPEISVGRAGQLLLMQGTAENKLRDVRIEGVGFACTNWHQPAVPGNTHLATTWQGEIHVPGVLEMRHAQDVTLTNCDFGHLGFWAIQVADGVERAQITGNQLHHLGAGGVHVNGSDAKGAENARTRAITIADNHIHHGGRLFHAAIGVLLRHAADCIVARNHIHDFYYSGISVGWVWGYGPNVSRNNVIEGNYIHHLGEEWLSDMAGIYTLGVQPGTVLRGNVVHDVNAAAYGGWAYYFDEGSSEILMENNVGFAANHNALHLHYGRENRVINNILASGGKSVVHASRDEKHTGLILERNILLTSGKPIFTGTLKSSAPDAQPRVISDKNLAWDLTGEKITGWEAWVAAGHDANSVVANPALPDAQKLFGSLDGSALKLNLAPPPDSPARKIGFEPITLPRGQ